MSTHDPARRAALGLMVAGAGALLSKAGPARGMSAKPALSGPALKALRESVAGRVIAATDPDFNAARSATVWNQRVAGLRRPDAIVQVGSVQDVVNAVKFARAHRLKVAPRSGGHNYEGAALRDGGILLDLSRLDQFEVSAPQRRASVQPALKGGAFAAALAPHSLAFPVGHASDVSLGGYILNGGFGWNFGEWGPACMSVTGMEMVTAAGELLYADEKRNADLYWAARGAGPGFFAVVTRFDVVLQPHRPGIQIFAATFELASAPRIATWLSTVIRTIHPTVEVIVSLGPMDASGRQVIAISAFSMAATQAEASTRITPLRSLPTGLRQIGPALDQATTLPDILQATDAGFPSGRRMAGDQMWSAAAPDVLVSAVLHLAPDAPPAPTAIAIVCTGGNGRSCPMPLPDQAALSKGGGPFIGAYAFWSDPAQDEASRAWVRRVLAAAAPYSAGRYVGEADLAAGAGRVQECFSPAAWQRLVALRQTRDPDGAFYSYLTT